MARRADRKEAKDKSRVQNPNHPKRGNTMVKKGDTFKNIKSGTIFTVKSVDPRTILLGTKDGFQSMFVSPSNMESVFVPFVEGEAKEKPKE